MIFIFITGSFKSLEPVMQSKSELFSAYFVKPVTRYNKVTTMSKLLMTY